MSGILNGQMQFNGDLRVGEGAIGNKEISAGAAIARSKLAQNTVQKYIVPLTSLRVWNALETLLPQPSANDDLGWPATQTFGTVSPYLETRDLKTLSTSLYARGQFTLPPEYDAGETVLCQIRAGALTTVADTSLDLDLSVYEVDRDGGVGSDLCSTAAIDINNLTLADNQFTINATSLAPGDQLDFRLEVAVVDSATGTVVKAKITEVAFLLDIRG